MSELPGLYVHVPFCRSKCAYCTFYSITDLRLIPAWLSAVHQEALLYRESFGPFDTLYLGGGTPSLLPADQLTALMAGLRQHLTIVPGAEITLEANPDDVTPEGLALWRDLGINRLSLGVQSFDDRDLAFLGRRHQAQGARQALNLSRKMFAHLSVDLMYGLAGQTLETWAGCLKEALEFTPEHLSCYQLSVEEGTRLGALRAQGRLQPLGEERERRLYLFTSRFLEEWGFLHYEVSNFARDESCLAHHNRKYWRQAPFLGLGPGAHSCQGRRRWWNHRSVAQYCQALQHGEPQVAGEETLSAAQQRLETLFLGFRTREGVQLEVIRSQPQSAMTLSRLKAERLVRVTDGRVRPTRQGMLVADSLALLF